MANKKLPEQINPFQLADNKTSLRGEIQLSTMERLRVMLVGPSPMASFELCFGRDAQGYAYLRGGIKTCFEVICQRCNHPMSLKLDIKMELSPVRTDKEAERLPKHYDPLLVVGDTITLVTMIEDEILLNIPIVPKHSKKECLVKASGFIEQEDENEQENPFTVLKKLLRE
jgi:uncharacterized protein